MRNVPATAAVVLAACLAATAATANGAHSRTARSKACSATLAMQTVADRDKNLVRLTPTESTVGELGAFGAPKKPPKRRSTTFQRRTWKVAAQITSFRTGPSGEIQLVLYDHGEYMSAWIPARACPGTRPAVARAMAAVRAKFVAACGRPRVTPESLGAVVFVTGVGYWGRPGPGAAKNGAALTPVTDVTLVAGCGV
jgi:hypothetical protein